MGGGAIRTQREDLQNDLKTGKRRAFCFLLAAIFVKRKYGSTKCDKVQDVRLLHGMNTR